MRDGPRSKEREEIEEVPAGAGIMQVETLGLFQIVDLPQTTSERRAPVVEGKYVVSREASYDVFIFRRCSNHFMV
jgi:hypothetical protein